jgi:TusE/DsrC/DsvC family sulfur relay protein
MVINERLDEEGFVIDSKAWSEDLSKKMAETQFNIALTEQHLQVINFVRQYYFKWETLPMIKTIRDQFKLDSNKLDEMFSVSKSTSRGVICKLGGLPKMLCIASGC